MVGFTKLHGAIIHSSIWAEPHYVRIVWVTMLAMCDANGMVEASASGLARAANVTRDECNDAIANLSGPDPDSRDGTTGERIERVPGGFQVINYANYRERQTREQAMATKRRKSLAPESEQGSVDEQKGYVYYAADGSDLVKIGYSVNPWARLTEMRTANPSITLLATERGDFGLETKRHHEWAELRTTGEWFQLTGSLRSHIDQLRDSVATTELRSATTEPKKQRQKQKQSTEQSADKPRRARAVARPDDVPADVWEDFKALRKTKKAPLTPTAWKTIEAEAGKARWSLDQTLRECVSRGWAGFRAEWVSDKFSKDKGASHAIPQTRHNSDLAVGDDRCECLSCKAARRDRRAS